MKKHLLFLLFILFSFASYLEAQTLLPISEGINSSGSNAGFVIKLRDHVYLFRAMSSSYGYEPYVTDGTQAGTFLLKDINAGNESSYSNWFYRISDTLCLFYANDGNANHGNELWRSNGTTAGTYMVTDLTPGAPSSSIWFSDMYLDNKTFFTTHDSNWIGSLYVTDGSTLGTTQILTGFNAANPQSGNVIAVANGIAYFYVTVGPYSDLHLWRTDGTVIGTYELTDLNVTPGNQTFGATLGNDYLFSARDSVTGQELWKTDGTIIGTALLKDLNPGMASSYADIPHLLGNKIIFLANPNNTTTALWVTDGTPSGTYPLGDSTIFPSLSLCWIVGRADSNIYFGISDYYSSTMWKTDGTIPGTVQVHTFPCNNCGFGSGTNADTLAEAYGLKFFVFGEAQYIGALGSIWATDGTDAGTYQVYADPDIEDQPINQLTGVCGKVFCEMKTGYDGEHDHLWRIVQDSAYDLNLFSNYWELYWIYFVDDGSIFFSATDSVGLELYQLQVCPVTTVQNFSSSDSLLLFPNPGDGLLTVKVPGKLTGAEVRVNDMMGKYVYSGKAEFSTDGKLNLHLKNIPAGMYSLQIISNGKVLQQIFIKQ
ncbi:MAG TPA: T9SS type A sorting domain-containing protein [Chitinophagales bacterium]|nr:T9SS type A sorting domain-containing protein [Chitinophagales bacterium]